MLGGLLDVCAGDDAVEPKPQPAFEVTIKVVDKSPALAPAIDLPTSDEVEQPQLVERGYRVSVAVAKLLPVNCI